MRKTVYSLLFLVYTLSIFSCSEDEVQQPVALLALGDSYTIGENVDALDGWPQQLTRRLQDEEYDVSLRVVARTGWTTAALQNAMQTETDLDEANLVGLLIGVNDQFNSLSLTGFSERFTQLLDTATMLAGSKERVFVMSIPDYSFTPFGQGFPDGFISAGIGAFNRTAQELTDSAGIRWFNITPISEEGLMRPDLISDDGLHPSALQYQEWVDFIYPDLLLLLD